MSDEIISIQQATETTEAKRLRKLLAKKAKVQEALKESCTGLFPFGLVREEIKLNEEIEEVQKLINAQTGMKFWIKYTDSSGQRIDKDAPVFGTMTEAFDHFLKYSGEDLNPVTLRLGMRTTITIQIIGGRTLDTAVPYHTITATDHMVKPAGR